VAFLVENSLCRSFKIAIIDRSCRSNKSAWYGDDVIVLLPILEFGQRQKFCICAKLLRLFAKRHINFVALADKIFCQVQTIRLQGTLWRAEYKMVRVDEV
jgi:hypothetical protein